MANDMPGKNPLTDDCGVLKFPCASIHTSPQRPASGKPRHDTHSGITRPGQDDQQPAGGDRVAHRDAQPLVDSCGGGDNIGTRRLGREFDMYVLNPATEATQQPLHPGLHQTVGPCDAGWVPSPAMKGTWINATSIHILPGSSPRQPAPRLPVECPSRHVRKAAHSRRQSRWIPGGAEQDVSECVRA
jgi:hypothetical protein